MHNQPLVLFINIIGIRILELRIVNFQANILFIAIKTSIVFNNDEVENGESV